MPVRPDLSVVIPAFNEARRLAHTINRIIEASSGRGAWEIIVIDDGSVDDTAGVAATFPDLRVFTNPRNMGKGYSVRRGMLAATGNVRLYCDADLSTPIEEIDKLLPWLEQGYDVVIASRDLPESVLAPAQPTYRRVMGDTFRFLRQRILLPRLRDTQCGFKCFSSAAAERLFPLQRTHGFAFDCELLGLARQHGFRIKEQSVTWRDDRDSRVRPVRDSLEMLVDLIAIRRRLRRDD